MARITLSPTNRAITLIAMGAPLSLLLCLWIDRLWIVVLIWISACLLAMLVDGARSLYRPAPQLDCTPPTALYIGRPYALQVRTVFEHYSPPRVEITVQADGAVRIDPQISAQASDHPHILHLVPTRRGKIVLESIWVRWSGPWGLMWRQSRVAIDKTLPVLMNTPAIEDFVKQLLARPLPNGERRHTHKGQGTELNALREFTLGSDRRMLDWKQSARHQTLLVREYHQEFSNPILLMLDCGRVMCEALDHTPRIDHAMTAAMNLSFSCLRNDDKVGILAFDSHPRICTDMVSGQPAFADLQRVASQIAYSDKESDYARAVSTATSRLRQRTLIILFTDFSDIISGEQMIHHLQRLVHMHRVLVVVFRDNDLDHIAQSEPIQSQDIARALVAGNMIRDRITLFHYLRSIGIDVLETSPEETSMALITKYLLLKKDLV